MNPVTIGAALLLFIVGIFVGKTAQNSQTEVPVPSIIETITPESSPSATIGDTPIQDPTTTQPQANISPTLTSQPTNSRTMQTTTPFSFDDFTYPGATIEEKSDTKQRIVSSTSPNEVTYWYETLLQQKNYNSTSKAKTNSNGNIMNKLGGSNGKETVMITIEKTDTASQTTITLEVTHSDNNAVNIRINNHSSD